MKPRSAVLSVAVATAALLPAAWGQPKPNTLTPEQVSAGWILLFDGETLFGWAPRGDARWDAADGCINYRPGTGGGLLSTTTEFADFELRADFWIDARANSGVLLRCPVSGEVTSTNAYEVNIFDAHEKWPTGSINEVVRRRGEVSTVGRWNTFELRAEGERLQVRLNGEPVADGRDRRHRRGTLGLQNLRGDGSVRFRNLQLRPLGLHSLFNGKDLTGWKSIPGRKSVFSATPEGWLHVRDGNGDLQSEGEFGDFLFQLDILSNGTHLNSGVFFRAIAGQFWSGYESQIRNQWEGEDRTKPVDYGTGGLYNRQPARRVVSSDREWFTKTIVAHGAHFATWVNGIQVVDFTDTRPPRESAREGYRAKAGVLSLQGHDPTTDLSFRNLRITELPPARAD